MEILTLATFAIVLDSDRAIMLAPSHTDRDGEGRVTVWGWTGTAHGLRVSVFQSRGGNDWPGTMWTVSVAPEWAGPGVGYRAQAYGQDPGSERLRPGNWPTVQEALEGALRNAWEKYQAAQEFLRRTGVSK